MTKSKNNILIIEDDFVDDLSKISGYFPLIMAVKKEEKEKAEKIKKKKKTKKPLK